MKKEFSFLITMISALFLGCSENQPPPSSYNELQKRIHNAVEANDLNKLESLFYQMPEQWVEAREVSKQAITLLSESGFIMTRGAFLHSQTTIGQSWSVEPEEFLRLEGAEDETESISIGFFLGKIKGGAYIVYPSRSVSKTKRDLTYYLVSTPDVTLGKKLPTTFQSSWSGLEAKSYSMDNLAASLTRYSGINIVNKTGIDGDYDFSLKLNAAQDPSNIKMDLRSIGLDLVSQVE